MRGSTSRFAWRTFPNSASVAIRVGEARRVVVAAPDYLARYPRIERPGDLVGHRIIATTHSGVESWSFPPAPGCAVPRAVQFTPRLMVNSVRAAIASAVEGCGVTRAFSCQIAKHVREGELEIVLAADEEAPIPVHLLLPTGRLSMPKARAFVDFAVPRLRNYFAGLARDAEATAARTRHETVSAEPYFIAPGQRLVPEVRLAVPATVSA